MFGEILTDSSGICHRWYEPCSFPRPWHPSVALATGAAFEAPVQVAACSERRSSSSAQEFLPCDSALPCFWVSKN